MTEKYGTAIRKKNHDPVIRVVFNLQLHDCMLTYYKLLQLR